VWHDETPYDRHRQVLLPDVYAVRPHRESEVHVVVDDERNARLATNPGERLGQRKLEPLLASLVA
jgi:hypothetical protein